jgi:hypothetical protein
MEDNADFSFEPASPAISSSFNSDDEEEYINNDDDSLNISDGNSSFEEEEHFYSDDDSQDTLSDNSKKYDTNTELPGYTGDSGPYFPSLTAMWIFIWFTKNNIGNIQYSE